MLPIVHRALLTSLRWSERYTKTDMVYAVTNAGWLTLNQIFFVCTGIALTIAFGNLVSKEAYGTYQFVLSMFSIASATTLPALNTALTRSVARNNAAVFRPILRERMRWSAVGFLGLASIALYYAQQDAPTLALSLLIAACAVPFFDTLTIYVAYRNGLRDFRTSALGEMSSRLVGTVVTLLAINLTDFVPFLLLAYFVGNSIVRIYFFLVARSQARQAPEETFSASAAIVYGRHLSVIYAIGTLVSNIDKILLFHVMGSVSVAAYALALMVPDQLLAIAKNVSTIAYPKFAAQPFATVRTSLARKNAQLLFLTSVVGVGYVLAAPAVFALALPAYPEMIPLTQLLTLGAVETLSFLPLSVLKAHGMTRALYRHKIVSAILQIILVCAGLYTAGLYGLIVGSLLSKTCAVAYLLYLVRTAKA